MTFALVCGALRGCRRTIGIAALLAISLPCLAAETASTPLPTTPPPATGALQVAFELNGEPWLVERSAPQTGRTANPVAARYEAIARALVAGPSADERNQGVSTAVPAGTQLGKIVVPADNAIEIYLDLPQGVVGSKAFSPRLVEQIGQQFHKSFLSEPVRSFTFFVKDPQTGDYRSIRSFLPAPKKFERQADPPGESASAKEKATAASPVTQQGPVTGALSNKTVVLNPGHGWLDDTSAWRVQRTKLNQQLEDYSTLEFMANFAAPALMNAGARIQSVRELDQQTNMVIVDNAEAAPAYAETGSWANSTANGFVNKAGASWNGVLVNPFGNANATRYAFVVTGSPGATATYAPSIPGSGFYNVYVTYSSSSNRSLNAHWQVHHTGGVADFYINQQRDGGTWVLLGNFHFETGRNASTGKVVLLNDGTDTSKVVVCDAVRFGGGSGDVARRTHGVSGKPRWQEEAMNYLNFTGAAGTGGPLTTDDTVTYDDEQLGWGDRPAFASWEQSRDGEGANTIYIGYHTNALDGTCSTNGGARGCGSFRDVDADASAATVNLTAAVHAAVMDNTKKFCDSTFPDRGITKSNGYGECSQGNLGSVAGFFFESLFADNSSDVALSKDPKFRLAFARGIQQGVITYFGGSTFPPEPPTNFRVKNIGGGQVRLDWTAGPVRTASLPYGSAATSYRVYTSPNGYGFNTGTDVATNNATINLGAGQLVFFRVAAVNSAGISFPTETLGVLVTNSSQAKALVVNGSHRFDQFIPRLVSGGVSNCGDDLVRKIQPLDFQSFNYVIRHAQALSAAGISFDSCSSECTDASQVSLTPYSMVDWIGAQEAETDTEPINTDDQAIKAGSRTALQNYLQGGGKVFMSSSELAWDFGRSGVSAPLTTFLNTYMKATYVADAPGTGIYTATGVAGGIFSAVSNFTFDNGTGGTYQVRFPDVLGLNGGATACLNYVGGTSNNYAAIQYSGNFGSGTTPGKLVYLGFGFETIVSQTVRNQVMQAVINYFGVASSVEDWPLH